MPQDIWGDATYRTLVLLRNKWFADKLAGVPEKHRSSLERANRDAAEVKLHAALDQGFLLDLPESCGKI